MSRIGQPVAFDLKGIQRSMRGTITAEELKRESRTMRRRGPVESGAQPIEGRITAAEVSSGEDFTTVWKYSFVQTTQSEPGAGNLSTLEGGVSGSANAYNRYEEINPDADADTDPIGIGLFPADLTDGVTSVLGPVPNGTPAVFTPVVCVDGTLIYRFNGINTLTMTCGEE